MGPNDLRRRPNPVDPAAAERYDDGTAQPVHDLLGEAGCDHPVMVEELLGGRENLETLVAWLTARHGLDPVLRALAAIHPGDNLFAALVELGAT